MRKNSNLPALQLHNSSSVKHHSYNNSKDSVRAIQSKITKQQTQIQRNQKVILTLTNQFRLLRDEFKLQRQQNQQLSQMYRKTADQNQKLTKLLKQNKNQLSKLQRQIEQRRNQVSSSKQQENMRQKQYQDEIKNCREQILSKNKQIKVMEATHTDLVKQIETLRKKNKELISDKAISQNLQQQKQQMRTNYIKAFTDLNQKINNLVRANQQLEQQTSHLNQIIKQKQQKSRQLSKTQMQLKQTKEKLVLKIQQVKLYRQRMQQLQKTLKNSEQDTTPLQLTKQIQMLQLSENQLKVKNKSLLQKSEKFQKLYEEQHQLNNKKQNKLKSLKKLVRNKQNIERVARQLKQSIICEYCKQILEKPVTNIPCGHSYCISCKKGYQKQCKKCTNVKRQAVYRNQLMDQIISAFKAIKDISDIMTNFSDNQY